MASNIDVLTADKLLFAVDLVDHVIIKTRPNFADKTMEILNRVDHLRNFIYNRFNEIVKKAINIIDINQNQSVSEDFLIMMNEEKVSKESLIQYANSYKERYFPETFNPKHFLKYCNLIANMAGYFISYGIDDAPDIAVELILRAFPDGIMYNSTWTKLHNMAQSYVRIGGDYFKDTSSESDLNSNENSSDSDDMEVNDSAPVEIQSKSGASGSPEKILYRIDTSSSSVTANINTNSGSQGVVPSDSSFGGSFHFSGFKISGNGTYLELQDKSNTGDCSKGVCTSKNGS